MTVQTVTTPKEVLDFYAHPLTLTVAGRHARLFAQLPTEIATLTKIVQGLTLHRYMAAAYGVTISDRRFDEDHIRPVEQMIDRILAIDARPLTAARPPEKRLVGVCRHFAVLLVAMLRAQGVPARARVGFGRYFNPGYFEDHWVCEYWKASEARWVLVDPQFDDVWRANLKIKHDILDVPRDQFLVASDAWTRCRSGQADPSKFGIFQNDLRGLWFIAGDLVRDVAALNKS
jgi:transglutaminase-like putative cysteine protease